MFELMEIDEQVYEGGTPSKTTNGEDSNCAGHIRKYKGGESALSTNPKKGCIGKCKKNYAGHPSDAPTGGKTCLLHGPGHSTEECKVLQEYS